MNKYISQTLVALFRFKDRTAKGPVMNKAGWPKRPKQASDLVVPALRGLEVNVQTDKIHKSGLIRSEFKKEEC